MNLHTRFALPLLATAIALAPTAHAQELGLQFKKKHVQFGLTIGNSCAPIYCPPRGIGYERREWVPSHYETVCEQVFVAGREEQVFVPAVYAWHHDACGRPIQVVVCPARYETRCAPGHWETVTRQIFVEGGWRVRPCR